MSVGYILSLPLRRFLAPTACRTFATTGRCHPNAQAINASGGSRSWLSRSKTRIGKLILHGATTEEVNEMDVILKQLTKNWREYTAGSEGFITNEKWRVLFRHNVMWGDMLGHVNNVAYTKWAEAARMNWVRNLTKHADPVDRERWAELGTSNSLGLILKSIRVDYKFPIKWPEKITVYHKLSGVGDCSFTTDVIILSEVHQRPAARCMEEIVIYNYKPLDMNQPPGKAPVPEFVRTQFEEISRLQNEAAEKAWSGIRDINEKIGSLESRILNREER